MGIQKETQGQHATWLIYWDIYISISLPLNNDSEGEKELEADFNYFLCFLEAIF